MSVETSEPQKPRIRPYDLVPNNTNAFCLCWVRAQKWELPSLALMFQVPRQQQSLGLDA